mmetsp:Transcript_84057/g.225458  ORF Transcript_84057/g.225458 Transcript_84057/m.225458 type:complete len:497 (+) Transcript_84057:117-1607(+)
MVLLSFLLLCLIRGLLGSLSPARAPPMGWNSYNVFGYVPHQEGISRQMRALVQPVVERKTGGSSVHESLLELGYNSVGLDDGWQECSPSEYPRVDGRAVINNSRFHNMRGMVEEGHALGLNMWFYHNGQGCRGEDVWQHVGDKQLSCCIREDLAQAIDLGFDGIKVDGGADNIDDMTKWMDLIEGAQQELFFANAATPGGEMFAARNPDPGSIVELSSRFNTYRVWPDISPQFYSAMKSLQAMVPFLDPTNPLSYPGMWADPDALQAFNVVGVAQMSDTESRTHFAAWCVTSAPLVLGFDLADSEVFRRAYPVIGNKRAIDVNQRWAGHPGRLVKSSPEVFFAPTAHGLVDYCDNTAEVESYIEPWLSKRDADIDSVCGRFSSWSLRAVCRSRLARPNFTLCNNFSFPVWQLWAKVRPDGEQAVLLINLSPEPRELSFALSDVGIFSSRARALDVWSGKESVIEGRLTSQRVRPHDSIFLIVTPASQLRTITQRYV